MNTSKVDVAGPVVFEEEAAGISAHALGVKLGSTADDDMKRFERIDRERLIELHASKVADLNAQIEMLKSQTSNLRNQIRRLGKREDRLVLGLAAVAMLVAYFYFRDFGCAAPVWATYSGF